MDTTITSKQDPTLITGPLVLGFIFGSILYGILCVQILLYYTSFPKDSRWIKIYVATLFGFETLFTLFSTIEAWNTLGTGWGDPHRLSYLDWSAGPLPSICGIVTSMVHAFYCWRIVKLTGWWLLPGVIALVSLTQLAMTIALTARFAIKGLSVNTLRATTTISAIWLLGAAFCDIIIALSMVFILVRARRKSSITAGTNTVIHRLIKLVVETGVVTSWGAIMDVSLFLAFKKNNLHFLVFYSLAKLYSNTMLATLNARIIIGGGSIHGSHEGRQEPFWRDREVHRHGDVHVLSHTGTGTSHTIELSERGLGLGVPRHLHGVTVDRHITFSPPLTPRFEKGKLGAEEELEDEDEVGMNGGGVDKAKGGDEGSQSDDGISMAAPLSPISPGTTVGGQTPGQELEDALQLDLEPGCDIGDHGSGRRSHIYTSHSTRMEASTERVMNWHSNASGTRAASFGLQQKGLLPPNINDSEVLRISGRQTPGGSNAYFPGKYTPELEPRDELGGGESTGRGRRPETGGSSA